MDRSPEAVIPGGTDEAWERWGALEPYYGVLTDPKFRARSMTPEVKEEFFRLGDGHVDHVINICRRHLNGSFEPRRVLDFGCGVGRLLIPFAQRCADVTGMDVSPSMLAEAKRNCEERAVSNVTLVHSDDALSAAPGTFDLVHSVIVLQHIEIVRGRALFATLVDKVGAGGCGALHVTFGWDIHASTFGLAPSPPIPPPPSFTRVAVNWLARRAEAVGLGSNATAAAERTVLNGDPEMQMNFYNLSELMFVLHRAGVQQVHTELTDHGGALGAFLFFQRD